MFRKKLKFLEKSEKRARWHERARLHERARWNERARSLERVPVSVLATKNMSKVQPRPGHDT
jgi:hypothetical protein